MTLFVFVLQTQSRFILFLAFKINQTEIIQKLCKNQSKPELKCNGKCYLKDKIREFENTSEEPNPYRKIISNLSGKLEIILFVAEQTKVIIKPTEELLEEFSYIKKKYYYSHINKVFHPPQLVL